MRSPGARRLPDLSTAGASANSARPPLRYGWHIVVVVTLCAAAGLFTAAGLLLHHAAHERTEVESRALALAHVMAHAADREAAAAITRLEALSTSPAFKSGDLDAIRAQLVETPTPPGSWFTLRAAEGQLVNTLLRAEAALPRDADLRRSGVLRMEDIVRDGRPRVSPLIWAPARGTFAIVISMPTVLGPERRAVLLQTILPEARLAAMASATGVEAPWRVTLVDRNGWVLARAGRDGPQAGHSVPEHWGERMGALSGSDVVMSRDARGEPVLVAFARLPDAPWAAAVDIPMTFVDQPMRETLFLLGVSTVGLLILATACAWWLRRRIQRLVLWFRTGVSRAREAEARADARFRHYWDHTPESLFVVEVTPEGDFRFESLNPAHVRATGLTTADIAGKRPEECLPPVAAAAVRRHYAECVLRGVATRYEETLDLPGGLRDWETSLAPMRDPRTGRVTALFGTCRDVTERRRAERAVRVNEARLRLAQSAAGAGIWERELGTGDMYLSPEMYELLGLDPAAHPAHELSEVWLGLIHPDDRATLRDALRTAEETKCRFDVDCRFFTAARGADPRWMTIRGQLAQQDDQGPLRIVGVAVDVTERRRAQISARESLALLHSSLDALTAQVGILDGSARVVAANASYRRRMARRAEAEPKLVHAAIRAVAAGELAEARHEYRDTDPAEGTERWFQLRVTRFGTGDDLRLVAAHEDITEVKRSVQALKDVTGRLLTSQDEERRRIARDLHDSSAQDIAMALVGIDMARSARTRQTRAAALSEARDLLERAIRDIRTLSYILHPPLLDELGLAMALATYAEGIARRGGFTCVPELDPTPPGAIPPAPAMALFRVAQEAFSNVYRHSGARTVGLRLRLEPGRQVELRIADDGRGFGRAGEAASGMEAGDPSRIGVGIAGMQARLRQLGGRLRIESGATGTVVLATVPLAANDTAAEARLLATEPAGA
jgi:two-component system NarL family sensor kinase